MKRLIAILLTMLPASLFCFFVIWPPDLVHDRIHTLASLRLSDGNLFTVSQYWNHVDFYTTELQHTSPGGQVATYTLDGDDHKRWTVRIVPDSQNRLVTVSGYSNFTAPY